MHNLFQDIPGVIKNTYLVALKCNYSPKEKKPKLPKFNILNKTEEEELISISTNGLKNTID